MGAGNRFKKWLRKSAEKIARVFYEGPDLPPRFEEEVEIFEKLHPLATAEQWRGLVYGMMRNAYRDGYVRGYEHRERLDAAGSQEEQRLREADVEAHDWSLWKGQPTSEEMRRRFEEQRVDPFSGFSPEHRAQMFAEIGQHDGTYRVVWPGEDDPTPWIKDA